MSRITRCSVCPKPPPPVGEKLLLDVSPSFLLAITVSSVDPISASIFTPNSPVELVEKLSRFDPVNDRLVLPRSTLLITSSS